MKLEKHKNLREESAFYWREIVDGTLKFDRRESEVSAVYSSLLVYYLLPSVKIFLFSNLSLLYSIHSGVETY